MGLWCLWRSPSRRVHWGINADADRTTKPPAHSQPAAQVSAPPVLQSELINERTRVYDDKTAQDPKNQFDGHARKCRAWASSTTNYFIGRCAEYNQLLQWTEKMNHTPITFEELRAHGAVLRMRNDPVMLGRHFWAYLNLNLVAEAKDVFQNTDALNGFEVFRKLVISVHSKTTQARLDKRHQVLNPPRITKKTTRSLAPLSVGRLLFVNIRR